MPTIADITINGHTYTDAMWRADPEGTLSGIGNDISTLLGALANSLGTISKAISGNTTLTGTESTNAGFVFTGSLSADADITFAAGFTGPAIIENETTGGFSLICGLATGGTVTIPPSGSGSVFCDGTDFSYSSGIVRTSSGAKVMGDLEATGGLTVGGVITATGGVTINGALDGVTNLTINGFLDGVTTLVTSGNVTIGGILDVTGSTFLAGLSISGALAVGSSATFGASVQTGSPFNVVATGANYALIVADAEAGAESAFHLMAGSKQRWKFNRNVDLEIGSNAGSDLEIWRFDDAGVFIDYVMRIKRDTGQIRLNTAHLPTSSSGLDPGTIWSNSGVLTVA